MVEKHTHIVHNTGLHYTILDGAITFSVFVAFCAFGSLYNYIPKCRKLNYLSFETLSVGILLF